MIKDNLAPWSYSESLEQLCVSAEKVLALITNSLLKVNFSSLILLPMLSALFCTEGQKNWGVLDLIVKVDF